MRFIYSLKYCISHNIIMCLINLYLSGSPICSMLQLDDEHTADMTEFRLQFCPGDVLSSKDNKSFKTVYEGPLTCYTVRHLKLLACYSFRVCGKCDGGKWSPWCVPTVANTRLQPYGKIRVVNLIVT